ncbi:MAG: PilZ domain-containing protein [Candidatus Omnitrophica bacterium]|nr:PilZ domain-containing protein [Candidatus Omnitrophota bacterium]
MAQSEDRRKKPRAEGKDRRRYPRIKDKGISIQFKGDGFDAITQSLDVSASGIYCKIEKSIPLMTRLEIVLALPDPGQKGGVVILNVEGVVVREHPVIRDGKIVHYDVAIFFNALTLEERELIVNYIGAR